MVKNVLIHKLNFVSLSASIVVLKFKWAEEEQSY